MASCINNGFDVTNETLVKVWTLLNLLLKACKALGTKMVDAALTLNISINNLSQLAKEL